MRTLWHRLDPTADFLLRRSRAFTDNVRTLIRDLKWEYVRVPCDVRRTGV